MAAKARKGAKAISYETKEENESDSKTYDETWLGVTKDKYTNERNPLRYDLHPSSKFTNQKYFGPESSIRFNQNNYHGTWTTPRATEAGYVSKSNSNSLEFFERGTSSLIESDREDQSLFIEDLLFTILARFSEARWSLHESIRISEASGSGGVVKWSTPEKEWLFRCLVTEVDRIPQEIVGIDDISNLRSYLSNKPNVIPGAIGSTVSNMAQIDPNHVLPALDISLDIVDNSSKSEKPQLFEKEQNSDGDLEFMDEAIIPSVTSAINSIPKIPAIGDEWSDFEQTGGFDMTDGMPGDEGDFCLQKEPMAIGELDDALMDSIGPIIHSFDQSNSEKSIDNSNSSMDGEVAGNYMLDTETVAGAEIIDENDKILLGNSMVATKDEKGDILDEGGTLDRFFLEGTDICDVFEKSDTDLETMSLANNEDKAKFAVQDLYTMLQLNSLLKRVEVGRYYMGDNKEDCFKRSAQDDGTESNAITPSMVNDESATFPTNKTDELAIYCSFQNPDGGLQRDLRRLSNLAEKSIQATQRILATMDADFTDRSADVRGYSWLGNVLRFNEMKVAEWSDIIESKENFRESQEGLDDLEDIVYSDWDELSDHSEMWEFEKNVDLNHRSHFVDMIVNRPDSESPTEFAQRYEDEWDVESWEQEYDQRKRHDLKGLNGGIEQHEYEAIESPENLLEQYESNRDGHQT